MTIEGRESGDYFLIFCKECGAETENEYLGGDPAQPHFKAKCGNCGEETTLKLSGNYWKGLPSQV